MIAVDLRAVDGFRHEGKGGRLAISALRSNFDQSIVRPSRRGGVPVLRRVQPRFRRADLFGQDPRRGLAAAPAGQLLFADVGETVEERAGCDDHSPASQASAIGELDAVNLAMFDNQRCHLGLFDREIRLGFEHLLHPDTVLLLIALGAGRPNRRTAAGVQQAELDAYSIGNFAHDSAQGVDLTHQVTLWRSLRWPGLQDICAIRSAFMVIMVVEPMRAQARAASQPA